ncbi:protein tweety homolog 2 [Nothoprocta perdicaria]|uniref:protein tweety homolog 2 n=1 Tax=Nothoprocta perdicaria TaxID=30464 RepID=UPI000E1BD488|nr:protein tweety homolog 2 [Nothoprocta perdicaria]
MRHPCTEGSITRSCSSLLFLALVAAVCLGLNLLFLTAYLICLCCCKRDAEPQSKRPDSCCVTWTAVVAGLVCCAAVGAGFYGNSEANDGVYQLLYALDSANHTLSAIDALVGTGTRWLAYLLFFILVLAVCLLACLALAKRSRCLLSTMLCCGLLTLILSWASAAVDLAAAVGTSDFCVAPDKFLLNVTESELSTEVLHYYVYCEQSRSSPFQQALTVLQRSLTTMQTQTQALVQLALPQFPAAEPELLAAQRLLNASESSLQRLTALLDCRGLHKDYLDALLGVCYDGVEGLLYLLLFSLLVAAAFSTVTCAAPRAWRHLAPRERRYDDMAEEDPFNPQARRIAAHNPARGQLRSFCSYSSSLGSQSSLHPPAQTISNAPVSEYMNQAALFGGNPRYENVPLIGRGSPPPTYSPSMRATYLSVGEERARRGGAEPRP